MIPPTHIYVAVRRGQSGNEFYDWIAASYLSLHVTKLVTDEDERCIGVAKMFPLLRIARVKVEEVE